MTTVGFPKISARELNRQLDVLTRRPESEIDYSDIPRQRAGGWHRANPDAQPLVLELDADVTRWLQSLGKRAHTRVNSILRAAMKAG